MAWFRRIQPRRYAGAALLAAYSWLTLAGMALLTRGLPGPWYDATLHGLFIGFGMGAIFAHGLIIPPALNGRPVRLTLLAPLALIILHASVCLRVGATVEDARVPPGGCVDARRRVQRVPQWRLGSHWVTAATRLIDRRKERTYE